ncbi:MAG: hypothetical protein ACK55I_37495, partial [bacterium]
ASWPDPSTTFIVFSALSRARKNSVRASALVFLHLSAQNTKSTDTSASRSTVNKSSGGPFPFREPCPTNSVSLKEPYAKRVF